MNEDMMDKVRDIVVNRGFEHGIAISKVDREVTPNIIIESGKPYAITAWLPDEDITCVMVDDFFYRMTVDLFHKQFERRLVNNVPKQTIS